MTDPLDILGVVSPGIIGLLLGLASATTSGRSTGVHILFAGVGGYLGYLTVAFFMRWRDATGMQIFPAELTPSLILILVFTISGYSVLKIRSKSKTGDCKVSGFIGKQTLLENGLSLLLLTMTVINIFFSASLSPLSSWDGLDNWVFSAVGLINYELSPEGFMGTARTSDGPFPWFHERHPPKFYYIAALSGFSTEAAEIFRGWLIPSSFIWFCGALVVWGFVHNFSGRYLLSNLAAYLYCSLPLLENHGLLVGYADPWVVMSVLSAAAMLAVAMGEKSRNLFLIGILLSLVPMTIKNTGVIYSAALLLPLIMMLVVRSCPRVFLAGILLAAPVIFNAINDGFDLQIAGLRFAYILSNEYEDGYSRIFFGTAGQLIEPVPLLKVAYNYAWALVMNQSFSVVALFGFLSCCAVVCRGNIIKPEARMAVSYLLLVSLCVLVFFALPQLISENYAEAYGSPGSDMGASRFTMVVGPLLIFSLAYFPTASNGTERSSLDSKMLTR